ncbi:MAG: branched-chain amino acid ABC transporter substrate-binding protein [Gemmatimonadaceae bacterium]
MRHQLTEGGTMLRRRHGRFFGLWLMGLLVVIGCGRKEQGNAAGGGQPIRIAAVAPITGSQGDVGRDLLNGIQLAADQLNASGGVLGRRIELVMTDDAADPKQAMAVAQKLLADASIVGIVGHMNSGTTKAASGVYGPSGIPVVMPVPTNPEITEQGYTNLFRLPPTDFQQGEAVADFAINRAGKRRFAIIHDKTDYGQPLAEVVRKRVLAAGAAVVAFEGISEGDKDFRAVLTKIRSLRPDALFFGGIYNEGALVARQAIELDLHTQFLAADGAFGEKFLELGGPAANGAIMSFIAPPLNAGPGKEFADAFAAKFGAVKAFAPLGYDAMNVLAAAIAKAGTTTRQDIVRALHDSAFSYAGVTGRIAFNSNGNNTNNQLSFYTVSAGKFEPVAVPSGARR